MIDSVTDLVRVRVGEKDLAWIVPADYAPAATEFPTPDSFLLQLGFVVYSGGSQIAPHRHLPVERLLHATSEALFVKKGKLVANFYTEEGEFVESVAVQAGDLLLLISGGHGFDVAEDCVLIEIKQGPYFGAQEKARIQIRDEKHTV